MFLLLAIAGCGTWCAHQHWMRLDNEASAWRRSFWSWALRGSLLPAFAWSLANFGLGAHFPPLTPRLADAQAARQAWVGAWLGVSFAGVLVVLTFWAAVSYGWILVTMFEQARDRAELLFNVCFFGFFTALCGAALVYANGPLYLGAAIVLTVLPVVHMTLDLAEKPVPRPVYDRAMGQINFGKYKAAEWELISQLEKREDDFQGWLMLAELYARQNKNIPEAAQVILDICQHPNTQPAEISIACHKLADWQLEISQSPEGARAALELLCRKVPGTHFARMAEQRLKQLPRSAEELAESKKPKRIQLPALNESSVDSAQRPRGRSEAAGDANRLVQQLTDDPNNIAAREKLAGVLAADLGKVDLGIEQLRLLMGIPETTEQQKAKWLAQVAAWQLKLQGSEVKAAETLRELIEKFPQTAPAFAAQRQLFLLGESRIGSPA